MRERNFKTCVICGSRFPCPPSDKTVTCSPVCRRERARRAKLARPANKWTPEYMKRWASSPKVQAHLKQFQAIGTSAALATPACQRGCQNRASKLWVIKTPSGDKIAAINLLQFVRDNADAFGISPEDDRRVQGIASGFRVISRTYSGKQSGRPVYTCYGFGLAGPALDFPDELCSMASQDAINLWFSGASIQEIAQKTELPESTVIRVLQAAKLIAGKSHK